MWQHISVAFQGAGDSSVTPEFVRLNNFDAAIAAARVVVPGDRWVTPTGPTDSRADTVVDKRTTEETTAAYVQFNASFDIGDKPANLSAGLRWEETDVTSSALVPVVTAITWNSANEYSLINEGQGFTTLTGKYDYVLPSLDFNVELTEDVIVRFGYSETIGRPSWDQIQGGQTLSRSGKMAGTARRATQDCCRWNRPTSIFRWSGTTAREAICPWLTSTRQLTITFQPGRYRYAL